MSDIVMKHTNINSGGVTLVEQLRDMSLAYNGFPVPLRLEAADEIERLRHRCRELDASLTDVLALAEKAEAEIERLRDQYHVHALPDGSYTAFAGGEPHPASDHGIKEKQ